MRRTDREIKEFEEIVKVMERCEICRLAFHDDSYPYILPLNFGMQVEEGKIVLYFHGAREGKKYQLMAADNRVSFEMDCSTKLAAILENGNCTMEYESVIGQGIVEILPNDRKEEALDILMRHYRKEDFPYNKAVIPATTVFKLTVEACTGKRRKVGKKSKKNGISLVKPTMDYAEDIMSFRQEFLDFNPEENMGGTGNLRNCACAADWIRETDNLRRRETCPTGLVDSDIYLGVRESDNKIVGVIELRHHINHPVLSLWGGQIGYCIRPGERRKGYARAMLEQVLERCRAEGQDKVLITCDEGNLASEKTILACGGRYQQTVWAEELSANMKRFWVYL
ncbi:MAG: GNAT family N-acetyltransferase [Clostridium sp.]|nr:GNAT family N-acetyltransferase [Clostridium sp.]